MGAPVAFTVIDQSTSRVVQGEYSFDRDNGGVFLPPRGPSFPASPVAGEWFWNTGDGKLYLRNDANTAWIAVIGQSLGESNQASNANLSGVGVYYQKNGEVLEFKGIDAGSTKVTVTDDGTNHTVDVDIVPGNIPHQDLSGAGTNDHSSIDSHIASTSNPHMVDKSQVGLGNVTNDEQIKSADFPSSSVDSEIALFNGTTGKSLKRATTTGLLKAVAGVLAAAVFNQETIAAQVVTGTDTVLTDTLNNVPISPTSVKLWLNGIFQKQGAGQDYSVSGQTITWLAGSGTAVYLETIDELVVEYFS